MLGSELPRFRTPKAGAFFCPGPNPAAEKRATRRAPPLNLHVMAMASEHK